MRNALARRMKMNLILGEEERVAQAQHEQLLDLEKKLNEVETLRSDSKAVSDLLILLVVIILCKYRNRRQG